VAKSQTVYICQSCGAEFPKWQGRCPQCGAWNSLVETVVSTKSDRTKRKKTGTGVGSRKLSQIKSGFERIKTGIFEFDRVLGGGIVPGSIILLSGEPGIGKSTLLLQLAGRLAGSSDPSKRVHVVYVCGEESPEQIKLRAKRLGIGDADLELYPETDVDLLIEFMRRAGTEGLRSASMLTPLVVVDSIQTLTTEDLVGGAGSIGQVRECAERLRRFAKEMRVPIILVGHVTKSGAVAGPKTLEHLVDAVFSLEGDRFHNFRLLRALKNRFGSSFEVGVFAMGDKGLTEVENPSGLFLSERDKEASGSVVTATMEGTRPVLVEIQALVVPSKFRYPRRTSSGFNPRRLELLCAILEKRAGFSLQDRDIYVNVASGFRILEPAADLAVFLALASSVSERPLGSKLCVFGEVGLAGEVRAVNQIERRKSEALRLGFEEILAPPEIKTIKQALAASGIHS